MIRVDPLSAEVDLDSVAELGVEQAPPDPVAGLEHGHVVACVGQHLRRTQAG